IIYIQGKYNFSNSWNKYSLNPMLNSSSFKIFQVCWKEDHFPQVDPLAEPLDNILNLKPEQREYSLFKEIFENQKFLSGDTRYSGIFSLKFEEKTHLKIAQFMQWIKEHPGYDVYHINPFPHLEQIFYNVWWHGEFCHPGILPL